MEKTSMRILCVKLLALAVGFAAMAEDVEPVVSSPDGRVKCEFFLEDGRPFADVSFCGRHAFRSALGIECGKVRVTKSETRTVRGSWKPVWGFKSEYPENYTELAVKFIREGREGKEPPAETIYIRCYDEGFAVRTKFVIGTYSIGAIDGERTNWRFADGTAAWGITATEGTFPADPIPVANMSGSGWRMPLTLRIPGGTYASVFEAHVEDCPRSYIKAENGVLSTRFAMGVKEGRGETFTPWRAVALASSPAELVERAYFVENLNPPCAISDVSWIKPGFCVSDHGNFPLRTSEISAAAKSAADIGAKYVQIDWGWYGTEMPWTDDERADYAARHPELKDDTTWEKNTRADPFTAAVGTVPYHPYWPYSGRKGVEMDIPAIVASLKEQGLGLCLYVHGAILETYDMDELFATYEKWGVVGLKPGFVGYGSQAATDLIRRMCALAAKHHLWLDVHDLHVPDGLERTWPNLMTTEGGGGEEGNHPVRQDVALPFTRCLAGPFDYTPKLFNAGKANATKLHKLAMFVAYPGPTAVMRGSMTNLVENETAAVKFLRALPWNYDDTHVVDAEIARHLTVIRRKGDSFYIGAMTGDAAHETEIALDFLRAGCDYEAEILADDLSDAGTPRGYRSEKRIVRKGDRLNVKMSAAGGYCAVIRMKQELAVHGDGEACSTSENESVHVRKSAPVLGYQLDVSRCKVPTMEALYRIVDIVAKLGYNHFELYTEHTFAYKGHEAVWCEASPMTPEEVRALDDYCSARGIELVPNQNSFGHLAQWLRHPGYNDLADHPQGGFVVERWDGFVGRSPATLNPIDPRSLQLVAGLYDQLFPCFRSKFVNVGCDETVELEDSAFAGRSGEAVREKGDARVYLDFLKNIYQEVKSRNHTMMFWGDIVLHHPELISEIPSDAICLNWGYEADHPFEKECGALASAGRKFIVCPGTSAWGSLFGRVENMVGNIGNAVAAGKRHGAQGYLLADWGDGGHPQPWIVSLPAIVYLSHRVKGEEASMEQVAREIDAICGCKCGDALLAYGGVYLKVGGRTGNTTELWQSLVFGAKSKYKRGAGVTDESLAAAFEEFRRAKSLLDLKDAPEWVKDDFALLDLLARAVEVRITEPGKPNFRAMFEPEYRRLWLRQNRLGGLKDSLAILFGM